MTIVWWIYFGGLFAKGNYGLLDRVFWPIFLGEYLMKNRTTIKKGQTP